MTIIEKDTGDLMQTLLGSGPEEYKQYLKQNFAGGEPSFVGYIDGLLAQKGLKRQDVLIKANLSQKYGYKLLSGEAHTADRDKILRICFAMELTLQQTQPALRLYGMAELYPKLQRDVVLIAALGNRQYDIDSVNDSLLTQGLAPLYRPDTE